MSPAWLDPAADSVLDPAADSVRGLAADGVLGGREGGDDGSPVRAPKPDAVSLCVRACG